jgi:microcystin-dependent protein
MIKRMLSIAIAVQIFCAGATFAAKTSFIDGNVSTHVPGTRVTAAFLNSINTHRHDGQAVDGSGVLDYAIAGGSANNITVALTPALLAHVEGMPIYFRAVVGNTDAMTLTVNRLPSVWIVHRDGSFLSAGDIVAGQIVGVAWNGTSYQLTNFEPALSNNALTVGGQSAGQLSPPGVVASFAMPTAPSGWLPCDGRVVSRITYPGLFAAIGTIWGAGDNATTFGLPDLRGEFVRGWDNSKGTDPGRVFGSFQASSLASHSHVINHDSYNVQAGTRDTPVWTRVGLQTNSPNSTEVTGGTETRPRNYTLFYAIKY